MNNANSVAKENDGYTMHTGHELKLLLGSDAPEPTTSRVNPALYIATMPIRVYIDVMSLPWRITKVILRQPKRTALFVVR